MIYPGDFVKRVLAFVAHPLQFGCVHPVPQVVILTAPTPVLVTEAVDGDELLSGHARYPAKICCIWRSVSVR